MSFQIFNNKKLINKNLQSNLSRTVIIYTVNSNKSVWSVYKLCQGIHHPPETERWQSAERNKMAAVEQKKLGNISCKLQQFFLWNVGYLFNVKKKQKKTGAEREVFGLHKLDTDLFHPLWDQSRVSWVCFSSSFMSVYEGLYMWIFMCYGVS